MTARDHNKLLSVFFFIVGGFGTLIGLFVGVVYGLLGLAFMATAKSEGALVGGVFVIFAIIIGFFVLLISGLHLMSGWKLYKEQPGAKTWATISSILVLLNFPFGTALGVYGLWFLFGDMGKALYSGNTIGGYNPPPPAPPPQSWQ